MYQPSRMSERQDFMPKADPSLETLLADFQPGPSLTFDDSMLPPEVLLPSPGLSSGLSAPFDNGVLTHTSSLPPGVSYAQELMAASHSAPPIISIPQTRSNLGRQHANSQAMPGYQQQVARQPSSDPDYLPEHESATRGARGRGSSEEDPCPYVDAAEHVGMAKKQRRLAEKNRTAQKRYRERQKEKMHDFERQVELLSKQVDTLMREKANLESRNSLLERVVQLKDEQQHQSSTQKDALSSEELALGRALSEFHNIVRHRDPPMTATDFGNWDQNLVLQTYNSYANELMLCMLSSFGEDTQSPGYLRMEQLVAAHKNCVLQLCMQNPRRLSQLTRELKKRKPVDEDQTWRKCLEVMKLKKEQKKRLLELRNKLFERMEYIIEQRKRIIADLEASMPTRDACCGRNAHHEKFHTALQASEELKDSLELEHKEVGQFVSAYHAGDIVTPLQSARATIEAYPYMQDVFAIVDAIAAEEGEQSQGSFMANLLGPRHGSSLMPPDSAFRMISAVPATGQQQQTYSASVSLDSDVDATEEAFNNACKVP